MLPTKYWLVELYINDFQGNPYNPHYDGYSIVYDDLKTLQGVLGRMKHLTPFNKYTEPVVGFKIYSYYNVYDEDNYIKYVDTINPVNKFDNVYDSILKAQQENFKKKQSKIEKEF